MNFSLEMIKISCNEAAIIQSGVCRGDFDLGVNEGSDSTPQNESIR